MDGASDLFEKLPDEVYQLVFHAICDCKSLVRCMAVSKAFRHQSERVSKLSIACPGQFTSYVDKLQRVFTMVRRFHSLEALVVRVGQPKDEPPSWARCMRYAEIGSSVEKFIFMAAKTGEFSDLDAALRSGVHRNEKHGSSSEANHPYSTCSSFDEDADGYSRPSTELIYPELNLRQVLAPSNDVLRRMVPVIVFAIVQGLDEFRDSVPAFIHKFKKLKVLLLVDMLESVTVLMREHQIEKIRIQQRDCKAFQDEIAGKDVKGKGVEVCSSNRGMKGKGKDWLETNDESSSGNADDHGESSSSSNKAKTDAEFTRLEDEAGRAEKAETWRNCRGICIHGPGDSRGEPVSTYPFKRIGRDHRFTRIGSYRRRERSAEWMDESVRRRQENRLHRGLSNRRREENRAFRTWKLGKRDRESSGDDGSYSAQSVVDISSCSCGSSSHGGNSSSESYLEHPLAPIVQQNHVTSNESREESWKAREIQEVTESSNQCAQGTDREGFIRERLREGARKRQLEIEREALRFDITFWRTEEVASPNYSLTDVSMCIATHDARPLSVSELNTLTCSTLAGPLLAATIAHVNEQASFHKL